MEPFKFVAGFFNTHFGKYSDLYRLLLYRRFFFKSNSDVFICYKTSGFDIISKLNSFFEFNFQIIILTSNKIVNKNMLIELVCGTKITEVVYIIN